MVEDKISETMDKVRFDKNFQNPILRLGKIGNTYNQILSTTSIENTKNHCRAIKHQFTNLEQNIKKSVDMLKNNINREILTYKDINIEEIEELLDLESKLVKKTNPICLDEIMIQEAPSITYEEIKNAFKDLRNILDFDIERNGLYRYFNVFNLNMDDFDNIESIENFSLLADGIQSVIKKLKIEFSTELNLLGRITGITEILFKELENFIERYKSCRNRLFGFLFKKDKIYAINRDFLETFHDSNFLPPHRFLASMEKIYKILNYAYELRKDVPLFYSDKIDYIKIISYFVENLNEIEDLNKLLNKVSNCINMIRINSYKCPKTFKRVGLNLNKFKTLYENNLTKLTDDYYISMERYILIKTKLSNNFNDIPQINYLKQMKNIQDIVTTKMTYLLDERVVNFYDNSKATAKALRDIIKSKQKFPKNEFLKLKVAFPCILAGIRDYS